MAQTKNVFKISIGETSLQSFVELNGERLNNVRRASVTVDAGQPEASFLTMEILGEVLIDGEYKTSPIVELPTQQLPLPQRWIAFADQQPPRDGTALLLWSPAWEMSWGIVIGHFEGDSDTGGRWVTSEGECTDNGADFDPDAEVEVGDEAIDAEDGDENLGPTHWQPLPLTPSEGL